MSAQSFYCSIWLLFFCSVFSIGAGAAPLETPFNIKKIRAEKGQVSEEAFRCKAVPKPVKDLKFERFYTDSASSKINPEKHAAYKNAYKKLNVFEYEIIDMANAYAVSKPARTEIAECALNWLFEWASAYALLGETSDNGEYVRKWSLAVMASAYAQIQNAPTLSLDKKSAVEDWLYQLAETVVVDFEKGADRRSRQNNHIYWAAWAVGITGAVLNETRFYDWALDVSFRGVGDITTDGYLPLELERKNRALNYHMFAAIPLIMLAELGEANGTHIYPHINEQLHHLVDRIAEGVENPKIFEDKTGADQNFEKVLSRNNLAWLPIYRARFPNRHKSIFEKWGEQTSGFYSPRVGGDTDLLFTGVLYAHETDIYNE